MFSIGRIPVILLVIWVFIYTISYGAWNWKQKNRLGAVAIMFIALAAIALPVYTLFIMKG